MALKIISAKQFATKLKATIQATGRLGFTDETAKYLELTTNKYVIFARDEENDELYLVITEKESEDAFVVKESSGYFYVPARQMFDMLGMDYSNNTIMFDLVRKNSLDDDLKGLVFFMKQRIIKRKEKNVEK